MTTPWLVDGAAAAAQWLRQSYARNSHMQNAILYNPYSNYVSRILLGR